MGIALSVPEQPIGSGHDVLDLGAVFRFQQRDRVDQHGLVGNQLCRLLQLGQRRPRWDAGLEHRLALQVLVWRQRRQPIER